MDAPYEPTGEAAETSGERATTHADPPTGAYRRIELHAGESVGRYTVVRRLGAGAMGVVYEAHDPHLDRRVAIKVLRQRAADPRESAVAEARLLREARALARLSHPNVVPVYDVGTTLREGHEFIFLAMELVHGETLRAWLADRPPPLRILAAMKQAGRGLAAAHAAGLVHRDFKLDNVIVDATGRARVMDFGLARPQADLDEESIDTASVDSVTNIGATLTRAGTVVGTPVYMSPEQHSGRPLDARSDQFSFCVALYEALYERRPFEGATAKQLARAKLRNVVRTVPSNKPLAELAAVIVRGLDPDPASRWPSMTALLRQLRPKRRRPWVGVTAGALAIVGVATTALLVLDARRTPCSDAEKRIADVWNDDERQALRAAFYATGSEAATDTWDVVSKRLDGYVTEWTLAWQETCRAGIEASDEASAEDDRSALCLDDRRAELRTALEVLHTVDAQTLHRAQSTVAELSPPASCRREAIAAREVNDGPLPGTKAADAAALRRRAEVRLRSGQFAEANGEAFAALALATAADDQKILARTELLVGMTLNFVGELERAEAFMTSAVMRAESVEDDRTASTAAAHLCHLVGARKQRISDGLRWCRMGRAFADRIPEDTARLAHVLENEAGLLDEVGRGPEAIAQMRRAIELREAQEPAQPLAMAYNNLATMLAAAGEFDEARALHERALELRRELLGPSHPDTGMSYINLGALEARLQRWELAIELCERGMQIYRASVGEVHPANLTALQIVAAAKTHLGQYDESVRMHEQLIHIAEKLHGPDHVLVADTWANLGSVYGTQNRFEEAESAVAKALATYAGTEVYESKVAFLHHNLGVFAFEQNQLELAEQRFRHALELWQRAVKPDHPELGYPLAGLGRVLLARGRPREARPYLERARRVSEPLDREPRLAIIDFALARSLWIDVNRRAEAWALVERAREEIDNGDSVYDKDRAELEAWIEAHRDELPVTPRD